MELTRREKIKLGFLAFASPFAAKEANTRWELLDKVDWVVEDQYQQAIEEINELESEAEKAADPTSGRIFDQLEARHLYLGNPNHFHGLHREGKINDTEGLLEEQTPEQAFRHYTETGKTPYTPVEISTLLDDQLSVNLVYLQEDREEEQLVREAAESLTETHREVLPDDHSVTVDVEVEEPSRELEKDLDEIAEKPSEVIELLNQEYLEDPSTLQVYIVEPEPLKKYLSVFPIDFENLWAGVRTDEGVATILPSDVLMHGEDGFESTLAHEVGHGGFYLWHSAVRDDVMSYNPKTPTGLIEYGLPSELLIQNYVNSDLQIEQSGDQIEFQQIPGEVQSELAEEAVYRNVKGYIHDMSDRFGLNPENFQDWTYRREDGYDVIVFEQYDGMDLDMEVTVDGFIHNVEALQHSKPSGENTIQ